MNPTDGVTYWFDTSSRSWQAIGRPDIPADPAPPTPTVGYGSGGYGDNTYGG